MATIKKLVLHGFKSFAQKTEVLFDQGINVIVGPNGSGKSNVSDALCFVLGRLSIKSMRAAKAQNLLFMGSKYVKPTKEASVEIVFNNHDRSFQGMPNEVSIKRIVRGNGQSIYKLNEEAKTRTEIIEILAHAGIDPNGFNLVLQGQIQSIVRMHPEERRKVIEEVAGISIYESRKEKSLHELEKTEERLKEISTILKARRSYLQNLEKERSQALKFKDLEATIQRCRASILDKRIAEKQKEVNNIQKSIQAKTEQRDKIKAQYITLQNEINTINERIYEINKHIQQASGLEQDNLRASINTLGAELEGLRVRKENFENKKRELERTIEERIKSLADMENEIKDLRKESPLVAKKQLEVAKKKKELQELEEQKREVYGLKTELNSTKDRIKDKESQLNKIAIDSDHIAKQIEVRSINLKHEDLDSCKQEISNLNELIDKLRKEIVSLSNEERQLEKNMSIADSTITHAETIKERVKKLDVCPLCQNKMTVEHVQHVLTDSDSKISALTKEIDSSKEKITRIKDKIKELTSKVDLSQRNLSALQSEAYTHTFIIERRESLSRLIETEKNLKEEVKILVEKREKLQAKTFDISLIEEQYSSKLREIEEISARNSEDLDKTLFFKEKDLEKTKELIKINKNDLVELDKDINDIKNSIKEKHSLLEKKQKDEKELNERFKKMFKERDELQQKIQEISYESSNFQNERMMIEEQINHLKVGEAGYMAEKNAFESEFSEFVGIELLSGSVQSLEERLHKSKAELQNIGAINMRALEVYEEVKKDYDEVEQKADIVEKERLEIMKIIEEIDKKKKKTFMKTFNGINDLFSTNFSSLSSKGKAYLEIENKEDVFAGGISIVVKLAKGKYFDVTSLSGGEQTLIAISLLFAIQEYKPYHFYVLDEIDAALDKRNAERLSALLKKYIQKGQYIVITHNDALIMDSNVLYGVSMHDGVSKILSLRLSEDVKKEASEKTP